MVIVTKLKELKIYKDLVPNYEEIQKIEFEKLGPGRHELSNGNFMFIIEGPLLQNNIYECHKKYIDIQIPLGKSEQIMYGDSTDYKIVKDYSSEGDASLGYMKQNESTLNIDKGQVAIFLPGEPHKPMLINSEIGMQRKAVIKILWKN